MTIAYEKITDQIIDALEQGDIPWEKPWSNESMQPRSIHGKAYRGVNAFWLGYVAIRCGYCDPRWVTFNQAKKLGGKVRKGEKAQTVIFWAQSYKHIDNCIANKSNEPCDNLRKARCQKFLVLRYFNVFNVAQIDGLDLEAIKQPTVGEVSQDDVLFAAEEVVQNYNEGSGVAFNWNGSEAFYTPSTDEITVPNKTTFRSIESYYSTVFHEMAHSTGHESRLNRKDNKVVIRFGSTEYAKEELCAEMTNAFLCGHTGINNKIEDDQRVGYIQSWLKALKNDKKLVVTAAAQAQKAADFIVAFDK